MGNLTGTSMLFSQLDHLCDIEYAEMVSVSNPYHKGSSIRNIDWENATTPYTDIWCRLVSVTSIRRFKSEVTTSGQETDTGGRRGTPITNHYLIIKYDDAPTTLKDVDATLRPATNHRITNIRHRNTGTVIDTGPFDIQNVSLEGYANTVVMLSLLRTP